MTSHRKLRLFFILTISLPLAFVLAGWFSFGGQNLLLRKVVTAWQPQPTPLNWRVDDKTWMTAAWTDDDSSLIAIEKEVTSLQRQASNPRGNVDLFRKEALADLTNIQNLYRWSFAAHLLYTPLDKALCVRSPPKIWDGMYESLMRPVAPDSYTGSLNGDDNYRRLYKAHKLFPAVRSYRYSRMLFIAGTNENSFSSISDVTEFKKLGDRLLLSDPYDSEVRLLRFALEGIIWAKSGREFASHNVPKMFQYARELMRNDPKNLDYVLISAWAQTYDWDFKENDIGADKAIAIYNHYLKIAPLDAPHRQLAHDRIKHLEEDKAIWAKQRVKARHKEESTQ